MTSVLYIDDDEGLARLLSRHLAKHAMEVDHASTSAEALTKLQLGVYDVIALDHQLSGEVGVDLIPVLRKSAPGVPIIYVTGSDDVHVAMAALRGGAADYVWKDVHGHYREMIVSSIEDALMKRRMIEEREEAQRTILAAKERAEMLLAEVNHRVANSLAMISSLATLQGNHLKDPAAREALQEMKARILAIANIHRRLYTSSDVRHVDLDAYLKNLGVELAAAVGSEGRSHDLAVNAESGLSLTTDRAIWLAMVVTELVTNALKYAYPEQTSGSVRVSLARDGEETGTIVVEDDGVGWTGSGPARGTGLGSRIIQSMTSSLNGKLSYEPKQKGTRAVLTFPV